MSKHKLIPLEFELFQLTKERKRIENILADHRKQINLLREQSDLKYTLNRQVFKLKSDKLNIEKQYKARIEVIDKKIEKIKERIAKINEEKAEFHMI